MKQDLFSYCDSYVPNVGTYELNTIYCGDCVECMKQMPDGCVDLVVTSPPYDSLRDYKGKPSFDLHATGEQIYRILKEGGIADCDSGSSKRFW